jgi:hypothetical protein
MRRTTGKKNALTSSHPQPLLLCFDAGAGPMDQAATAEDEKDQEQEQEPLAPLVGLVERLRGEVTELQEEWEALGEELETQRRRLRLAEATVEMMQRRQKEAAPSQEVEGAGGGGAMLADDDKDVPQAAQASVGLEDEPLRGKVA